MKKLFISLLCAVCIAVSALGFGACAKKQNGISVYMPDGAPALALAKLMSEEADFGKNVNYHVLGAEEIASFVSYDDADKNADLCILPINDASKLVGDGSEYKMLGTVTHGNLYILSFGDKPKLTSQNFAAEVSGKKVGVVQLAKFPGTAFKLLLSKYGISRNVTLQGVNPLEVSPANDCDYFVVPEPAASTKVKAIPGMDFVGDLQELYGGDNGYPQAVLVAKNSLIENDNDFITQFKDSLISSADWLLSDVVSADDILSAIKAHYADPENTTPSFTTATLTPTVIKHCAVKFVSAADCKTEVITFLNEIKLLNPDFTAEVSDDFFYVN